MACAARRTFNRLVLLKFFENCICKGKTVNRRDTGKILELGSVKGVRSKETPKM
jgi:hypothetical protein